MQARREHQPFAIGTFHRLAGRYQMQSMATIGDTRHANLLLLLQVADSVQRFADVVERPHSQISQLKNRSRRADGPPRAIGDAMARWIEQRCQLSVGWMDQPQQPGTIPIESVHILLGSSTRAVHANERPPVTAVKPDAANELHRLIDAMADDPQALARAAGFLEGLLAGRRLGEFPPLQANGGP